MHIVRWVRPTLVSPSNWRNCSNVVGGILTWLFHSTTGAPDLRPFPIVHEIDVEDFGFWNLMDFRRRLRTITHLKQVKPNSAHHGPNSKTVAAVLASLIGGP
jgi:hypothetical protein